MARFRVAKLVIVVNMEGLVRVVRLLSLSCRIRRLTHCDKSGMAPVSLLPLRMMYANEAVLSDCGIEPDSCRLESWRYVTVLTAGITDEAAWFAYSAVPLWDTRLAMAVADMAGMRVCG